MVSVSRLSLFFTLLVCCSANVPGGFGSELQPATAHEQALIDQVKPQIESKLGRTFNKFEAVRFTTQVVAGTNYIIVINTEDDVLHAKIHRPLPFRKQPPFVMNVVDGKTLKSDVNPFEL
mmetsp:Transcript_15806/g.23777  ORF Transcript_15806/g.23777 Transcript_15806/m.23777 type:complete len:120 (+) Transcript_15806:120-479(+)